MFDSVRRRFLLVSSPTQVTISGSISTRVVSAASDPGSVCVPASNLRLYDGISYLQVIIKTYTHVFRVVSPLRYTGTELENAPFRPDDIRTQRRRGGQEVLCIVRNIFPSEPASESLSGQPNKRCMRGQLTVCRGDCCAR